MIKYTLNNWIFALCVLMSSFAISQSLSHPHIWIKDAEKQVVLDKISQNTWATNLFNQYKSRVDSNKNSHKIKSRNHS